MFELSRVTLALKSASLKADSGGYSFEGYASKFNGVDSYGDTILPGAYKSSIRELKAQKRSPKMFFNHNSWGLPVGKWDKFEEDAEGLLVAGTLTKGMTLAEDLRLALEHETLDGISVGIGMKSSDYEWIDDPKSETRRVIKNVTVLREMSLVTFPADDKGRVDLDSVKSELLHLGSISELEKFLRDAGGFSKAAATAVVSRAKVLFLGDQGGELEQKNASKAAEQLLADMGFNKLLNR